MPDIQINKWIDAFHQYKFDKLSFEPLFKRALLILKDAWLRCIKEDIDRFTTAYYITSTSSESIDESENEEDEDELEEDKDEEQIPVVPIPKQEIQRIQSGDTQIQISNDMIYIKRPWVNRFVPSAPSERRERFIEALENAMTEEERKRLRAERLERLRRIEENRKKALKAARERQKRLANEKEGGDASNSAKTVQTRRQASAFYIDRILPSKTGTLSKDSQHLLINNFQRYIRLSKTAPPKLENKLSLTFEIVKVFKEINFLLFIYLVFFCF
jgi:hypothetical protein